MAGRTDQRREVSGERPAGYGGASRDAGRAAAPAAQGAEGKFKTLLEAAPEAVVIVDSDGRITLVNALAEGLFGYQRDELLGRPVEVLAPERFRSAHVQHCANFFARPHMRPMGGGLALVGRHKDGMEIPVEVSLSLLETEDGL